MVEEVIDTQIVIPVGAVAQVDIKTHLQSIDRLPNMPEMTKKIFALSTDPDAGVVELVNVVVLDPSLCAQIMCYARSPFFNYRDIACVRLYHGLKSGFGCNGIQAL